MNQIGIADERRRERLTMHKKVVAGLLGANFIALLLAESVRSDGLAWFFAVLLILLVGTLAAGYGINLTEERCNKPKPIHCPKCRAVLPLAGEWRCGYCQAKNTGIPLDACTACGCQPKAIQCSKVDCDHAILLRAPLGNEPVASYAHDEQDGDQYAQRLENHRKQQEIFEQEKILAEAEAELLQAQEKAARAKKALTRAEESPEQTYEREVLSQLQSEGKRRLVMKKLRDEIEEEQDEDEREWKAGVLDRIERESLDL